MSKPIAGSTAIASPTPDPKLLAAVGLALKENVELLTGQRGGQGGRPALQSGRAITVAELVSLGVITQAQADAL